MAKATIGFIGAGHIGSQVARLAISRGYAVVMSNSRGPETLAALVGELGPSARAATAVDAAKAGDIVVVTVPLKNYREVPVAPLAGKIVIDTNNYYPQRDGHIAELDDESTTTAELLQAHLPTSKVGLAKRGVFRRDRRSASPTAFAALRRTRKPRAPSRYITCAPWRRSCVARTSFHQRPTTAPIDRRRHARGRRSGRHRGSRACR